MSQQGSDAQFFQTIPVTVVHRVFLDDSKYLEQTETVTVDATSFQELAQTALQQTDRLKPPVRCVISMKGLAEAKFTRQEHFVPEGLGFDWAVAPPGVGTCDEVNERFGRYEGEWLRHGPMGVYRPFYVGEGKDGPPQFHAPSKQQARVSFTRDEHGNRTLRVSQDVKLDLPDRAERAQLVIWVRHNEARAEWVSLAVHKMFLLMLWLCEGPVVFDESFLDLRRFLLRPSKETYRPYIERMVEGAAPGVELRYLFEWKRVGDDQPQIVRVQATMKAHHMRYGVVLAGEQGEAPEGLSWTEWADPTVKVETRTALSFGVEGLERVIMPGSTDPPTP